jgi:hypothetical protein
MGQEKQIVDGHHLGGAARRDEERVRGVHDVRGAGQHFDWGPAEAMPEQVQEAHRDAPVDDSRRQLRRGPGRGAVLPRRREHRHGIVMQ